MSARAGYVIVALHGELDVCTAADVMPALMASAASGSRVIVDLADLAFMDCGSLRELASARARAQLAGGDLLLAGPQPIVLRLLLLTEMISHWPVFISVNEAVSGARVRSPAEERLGDLRGVRHGHRHRGVLAGVGLGELGASQAADPADEIHSPPLG